MPIYEYQCQKCHHHLEALQKIADKPLRECPECGKHSLKRLVSAPRFRLAGSGWYETDFKSDGERKRNLAGKDEAPAAESAKDAGSDKAAESKPAVPPEGAKKAPSKTIVTKPAARGGSRASPAKASKKPSRPAARKGSRKR